MDWGAYMRSRIVTNRRVTGAILFFLSFLYFLSFIPPNLTGAADPNMLMVFGRDEYGSDEYAQLQVVKNMTTVEMSAAATLKNLLVYNYYYYGYPFFLTSTLSVLPAKV